MTRSTRGRSRTCSNSQGLSRVRGRGDRRVPQGLSRSGRTIGSTDGDELRRSAHSLKSTSATVGATALAAVRAEIERTGGGPALKEAAEREHAAARTALAAQREAYS